MQYSEKPSWTSQCQRRLLRCSDIYMMQRNLKRWLTALLLAPIFIGLSACDSSGDSNDFDSGNAFPIVLDGRLDTDGDGAPDNCDLSCIDAGLVADLDDDNDGIADDIDAYPLISLDGFLDSDGDGAPDDCEMLCIDTGMAADLDDDNDGIADDIDTYSLVSLDGLLDSDADGAPDDCDLLCIAKGMAADLDDDNDGVADDRDAYPLVSLDGLLDSDGDGAPDECDLLCADTGMTADLDDDNDGVVDEIDAYPLISLDGLLDSDGDGAPDDCDLVCRDKGMAEDSDEGSDAIIDTSPDDSLQAANFSVRESVNQLHVTDAEVGLQLAVYNVAGDKISSGETDEMGSLIFRSLPAGSGYSVRETESNPVRGLENLAVWSAEGSLPDANFYRNQSLQPGSNYITTRDGTRLSAYVFLPGPPEDGPYPTIVNYSGYEPSKPGSVLDASLTGFCGLLPVLCDAPSHPAGLIAGFMGYASVGVNMRGTGCSGGGYDYFEPLQVLDGYDIIETVAAQPWVFDNKVGMAGLSFPGISQLFVAQARPPSLAAIAPLSVVAETAASTLTPGGIFNNGFAFQWADRVVAGAQPYGQGWERSQVSAEYEAFGSSVCEGNQQLHSQAVDAVGKALSYDYYEPEILDPLSPAKFVDKITVPVFLTCAWQDEQTGPHCATLMDKFSNARSTRFITFNGLHADGYTPEVLAEWKAFLDLYVAKVVPTRPASLDLSAALFQQQFNAPLGFPAIPYSDRGSYAEALSAYESDMAQFPLRVIFDRGASPALLPVNDGDPDYAGAPEGVFSTEFSQWPPIEQEVHRLFFQPGGSMSESEPSVAEVASSFMHDPAAGQRTLGGSQPFYFWAATELGKAVVFVSETLTQDMVFVGSGSVDLFLQSTAADADIEVLLSEVRADGFETYVAAGWLRASQRALDHDQATALRPVHTHLEADAALLPEGQFVEARVEIMPFAHIFRAGSQIRIQVDTPGDSRELWKFLLLEYDAPVMHTIAHSALYPSSVALPWIPMSPVESLPPPPLALRGQPSRVFEEYTNTAAP